MSPAGGPDKYRCDTPDDITSCFLAEYGCCKDEITPASGPQYQGCPAALRENNEIDDNEADKPCTDSDGDKNSKGLCQRPYCSWIVIRFIYSLCFCRK